MCNKNVIYCLLRPFFKILNFSEFEIGEHCFAKHWKRPKVCPFWQYNKNPLVCFVVCITGRYNWSILVAFSTKVPLDQTLGLYKLNSQEDERTKALFLKIRFLNICSFQLLQNMKPKKFFKQIYDLQRI